MSGIAAFGVLMLLLGHPAPSGIKWEKSFEKAIKRAKAANKPVMIDFWAAWCGWCHRLDQTTYVDASVVKLALDFVAVKVDTEGAPAETAIAAHYDVSNLPTILFISPAGRQIMRVGGYQGPGQFPRTLETALETAARVMAWEAAIEKTPAEAKALMSLGVHLFEQEHYEESRELLFRAAKADKGGHASDRAKTRMLLGIIQTYDRKYDEAERLLKQALELKPPADQQPRILFVLGRAYLNWGKYAEARSVMQRIVSEHAGSPIAQKARDTLQSLERKLAASPR